MIFQVEVSLPGGGTDIIEVMAASEDAAEEIVKDMIQSGYFNVQAIDSEKRIAA